MITDLNPLTLNSIIYEVADMSELDFRRTSVTLPNKYNGENQEQVQSQ
jgi:hypothetical protein